MKGIALMAAANAAALAVEDAVQAMANRWLAKGTPLRQIVAADGREFNISNEGIPDAVPEG